MHVRGMQIWPTSQPRTIRGLKPRCRPEDTAATLGVHTKLYARLDVLQAPPPFDASKRNRYSRLNLWRYTIWGCRDKGWHVACDEGGIAFAATLEATHEASRFSQNPLGCRAASVLPAPAVWSPAKAQTRQETLLVVSESGPNNIDIHGVGTNVPGYEVSWNCYDRLISHEMKTLPNGTQYYDRDKFKMELAEDMNVGDMSATFKLRKDAKFQDGTPVTRQGREVVARSGRHRGRLPDVPDAGRIAGEARAVRRRRRSHHPRRFHPQGSPHHPRSRGDRAVRHQLRAGQEERQRKRSLGHGVHEAERLPAAAPTGSTRWTPGTEVVLERNDDWKLGPQPKIKPHHLAHGAIGRQPARAAGARRRRHLLRAAEQGFRASCARPASSTSCRRRSATAPSTSA